MGKPVDVTVIQHVTAPAPLRKMSAEDRARWRRLKLESLVERQGLNFSSLARATDTNHSYMSRIVSGDRVPSLQVTIRMARVLRVGLDELAEVLAA